MFTKQIAQLDELEGQVPPNLIQILRSMLGNCQQELTHRGEITLGWSPGDGSNGTTPGPANPVMNIGGGYTMNFQEGSILKFDPNMIIQGGSFFWAKPQMPFVNVSGAAPVTVPLMRCNADGTGENGPVFNATTELAPNKYTALFEDYVVRFAYTFNGTPIIISDIWDDPFGAIKLWSGDGNSPPDGWQTLDAALNLALDPAHDMSGRFARGVGSISGENVVWDQGGNDVHGSDGDPDNSHADATLKPIDAVGGKNSQSEPDTPGVDSAGDTIALDYGEMSVDSETDNRPAWTGLYYIERFE